MEAIKKNLYTIVEKLTTIQPARNYEHPDSLHKAAAFITSELGKHNGRLSFQELHNNFQNIILSVGPITGERIIVGAHYDVCGNTPGADDNASAVAGLLELARLVSSQQHELTKRVDFVAFNFEEPPFFGTDKMGSAVHASSLARAGVQVKVMICLEMIGYFTDEPGSQQFQHPGLSKIYPNTGNFIVVVGKVGQEETVQAIKTFMQEAAGISVQSINAPESLPGVGLSDHRNYWAEGYQAVMINDTSFLRNPHYHQPSDTIDTLDFDRMTEVVKGLYNTIMRL